MDILLILIIAVIVIVIGYFLSRPFSDANTMPNSSGELADYQSKYRLLLQEIINLEEECKNKDYSADDCDKLEEKKYQAAKILRKINAPIGGEEPSQIDSKVLEKVQPHPDPEFQRNGSYICQQCGSRVLTRDKFCVHCGNRLQP